MEQGSIADMMRHMRLSVLSEPELMICTHTIVDALRALHEAEFVHGKV